MNENVEQILVQEKERLVNAMDIAIKFAPRVPVENGMVVDKEYRSRIVHTEGVPEGRVRMFASNNENDVYLSETESHLYPWLYELSLRKVGCDEDYTREQVQKTSSHEFAHFAKALGVEGVRAKIGVSFYAVTSLNGEKIEPARLAVVPNVTVEGECEIGEFYEIGRAPGEGMSTGDEANEKLLQDYIRSQQDDD